MTVSDGLMEGGGKTCVTGSWKWEPVWGQGGFGMRGGLDGQGHHIPFTSRANVLSHCDTDNTLFAPGLQPRRRGDFIIQIAVGLGGRRWRDRIGGQRGLMGLSHRSVASGRISIVRPK